MFSFLFCVKFILTLFVLYPNVLGIKKKYPVQTPVERIFFIITDILIKGYALYELMPMIKYIVVNF